jgi:hypothetical protein
MIKTQRSGKVFSASLFYLFAPDAVKQNFAEFLDRAIASGDA